MGLPAPQKKLYSETEYLTLSQEWEERYEYRRGELLAMGRTSDTHSEIMLNLAASLRQSVKGTPCKVYAETVSLNIPSESVYYLPDLMLSCDEEDLANRLLKKNPILVCEILSPGSETRDRGEKFIAYLKIPSLQYYLLVSQEKVRVELFSKMPESKGWSFQYFESLGDSIEFQLLGFNISVADIYQEVNLSAV
ncbi:MAG: Uma2 family endonuclease [Bacteroidota bacterium]